MPGASDQTRRVKSLNANWVAGTDGDDGRFEFLIVTDDDERHVVSLSPVSASTIVALSQADTALFWDPADKTLIIGNIVGEYLPRH